MTDMPMQRCSKCGDNTMFANGKYCLNCGSLVRIIQPQDKNTITPKTVPPGLKNHII